ERASKSLRGNQVGEPAMNPQTQSNIQRAIGDLQTLREQWSGVETIDAERKKAEAKLDAVKQNVAGMRAEFNSVKNAHDQILKKAHEEQAKLTKLEGEVKRGSKELAEINAALAEIPGKLRGFDKFVADLRHESDKLAQINDGLNAIRVQVGA